MADKKRVAIQISGEFRCLHLTVESFQQNVVQPLHEKGYIVDIFIHCWERNDTSLGTYPFEGRGNWHEFMPVFSTQVGISTFKPSAYIVESLENVLFLKGRSRILAMYYSIHMANKIRKSYEEQNTIQYDIVVRYRTDCLIKKLMFNDIPSLASYLVIPRSSAIKYVDVGNNDEESICDLLAYGTPDRMDIYTDTFLTWLPIPETPIGEVCLARHLIQNNVRPLRPFIHFYLVEGNGEVRGEIVDPQEN